MTDHYDVIVVGGGNAGFSAAHAAREEVEHVLLFYHNYPGGSGLMAGSVFERLAGRSAANWAKARQSAKMEG